MSEEKLYALKNDYGDWADKYYNFGFCAWVTPDKNMREEEARRHGGHVVKFVEEPKKVVLTKEQTNVIEEAYGSYLPATYISNNTGSDEEEEFMMNAYVNGYTVENEKKYNVKVPHTEDVWYYKSWYGNLMTVCQLYKSLQVTFTEAEIEKYGLQDCEKEEVEDDEND